MRYDLKKNPWSLESTKIKRGKNERPIEGYDVKNPNDFFHPILTFFHIVEFQFYGSCEREYAVLSKSSTFLSTAGNIHKGEKISYAI